MEQILRSGNRVYVFDTVEEIPKIKDISFFPDKCRLFIDSVTLNPKDVNAQLYSQFTKETYSSFIYAFAIKFGEIRPTSCVYEQFEMNARRVERLCKRRNIYLSETELKVLELCKDLHNFIPRYKNQVDLSEKLRSSLVDLYL